MFFGHHKNALLIVLIVGGKEHSSINVRGAHGTIGSSRIVRDGSAGVTAAELQSEDNQIVRQLYTEVRPIFSAAASAGVRGRGHQEVSDAFI